MEKNLKKNTYTYVYLSITKYTIYINLMVTTNQKSIMDSTHKNKKVSNAHTKKKKESQPQHEDSHQITREQKRKKTDL